MKLSNHWRGLSGRRALCHWGTLRRRWELSTSAVGHLRRRGGRHAPDPRLRRPPHDNGSDPPRRVHLHAQRWSWGAAELRRAAEADDQGGRRAKQRPGGGRYLKHRPPLGPCRPLDQAPAVEIGRGLWSAAPSSSSGGHGSAARRHAGSSASARRPSRIPETFLELSPSVLGESVCWPEETTARRPGKL